VRYNLCAFIFQSIGWGKNVSTGTFIDYYLGETLDNIDPEVKKIIDFEQERQTRKIVMIPSESICPAPVLEALGSVFNNIYAEGYPPVKMTREHENGLLDIDFQLARLRRYSDRRFYKGCEYANFVESLAGRRAAELFATENTPADCIHVNVQPLSGAAANNSVYDTFVDPGDVVMGLNLMHGGHLTHGSEFNRSGKNYTIIPYEVDAATGRLNYDDIMDRAKTHRPKMIIAGYTSYPWAPDWKKFRQIADEVKAVLFADISHPAGLVIGGVYPNPIDYADVVTCTTHKTLFGPRGAIIMTANEEYGRMIDQAVFPGEQGGPHVNKFAAMAVAFKIAQGEEFKRAQKEIVKNASCLAHALENEGMTLAYGGTDTHLLLLDLGKIKTENGFPLKGEIGVRMLDLCGIVANKNTIPGDTVTAEASGIRLGTPWITQRGITEQGIVKLAGIIAFVLKNIHPFTYIGLTGDLPRGKVDYGVLREARRRVADLARTLSSESASRGTGYPHYTISAPPRPFSAEKTHCVLLLKGERVHRFIEQVTTNTIGRHAQGEGCYSFFFDRRGKLIAFTYIFRESVDEYCVVCRPEDGEDLREWLRGIADGYVEFDSEDIFKKVEGPAQIYDFHELSAADRERIARSVNALGIEDAAFSEYRKGDYARELAVRAPQFIDMAKPYFVAQNIIFSSPGGAEKKILFEEGKKSPKKSCLYTEHVKLTTSLIDFAGWVMPVKYEGIIEEHRAVREACGIFDVSHMGIIEVRGEYAESFLDNVTTNYVPWISDWESQYSYLLDPDGEVIDDIMVYRVGTGRYLIVVNAVNSDRDLQWMKAVNSGDVQAGRKNAALRPPGGVEIRDLKDRGWGDDCLVNIALQGPSSLLVLKGLTDSAGCRTRLERVQKAQFIEAEIAGMRMYVSRTGYTGENTGFELLLHPDAAPRFWKAVLDTGAQFGVKPVGLGARDSLRIEAGLPLYGHELAGEHGVSPIEAGFGSYVKLHKPFFIGRNALMRNMESMEMEIVRFRMCRPGVRIARTDDIVVAKRGQKIIGMVTSCAIGTDGVQVGMAYVDRRYTREGTPIGVIAHQREEKKKKTFSERMRIGERVQLHDEARIIRRFPEDGRFTE
jgi:glycine hydroxymethyltransferase